MTTGRGLFLQYPKRWAWFWQYCVETTVMSILSLILVLVIIGLVLWAINTYIPMQPGIRRILNVVVIIIVIIWLLKIFGLLAGLGSVRV